MTVDADVLDAAQPAPVAAGPARDGLDDCGRRRREQSGGIQWQLSAIADSDSARPFQGRIEARLPSLTALLIRTILADDASRGRSCILNGRTPELPI